MYISEISKSLHISKKAIELYEEKGLLSPKKNESGYRIYGEKERIQLKKIQILRKIGFSIAEIKKVIIEKDSLLFQEKKESLIMEANKLHSIISFYDEVEAHIMQDTKLDAMKDSLFEALDTYENKEIKDNLLTLQIINFDILFYRFIQTAFLLLFIFAISGGKLFSMDTLLITSFLLLGSAITIKESVAAQLFIVGLYLQMKEALRR